MRKSITIFCLLLFSSLVAYGQEEAYLRAKVDSLERVIRTLRRQKSVGAVSSLESRQEQTWFSRTGHYDSLGKLDEERPQGGRYDEVNFIGFPYEELIDRMLETYTKAQASLWSGILGRWFKYRDAIEGYFIENGLPRELGMLCVIESGCSPKAVSGAGAAGFWQFMPQTGQDLGLRVDGIVDERLDVDRSTAAAVKYLQRAYSHLGSWDATVAAYNWGTGNIQHVRERYGRDIENWYEALPEETRSYLPALIAALWLAEHYDQTPIVPSEFRENIVARRVTAGISFRDISTVTGIPEDEIRRQNPQYLQGYVPGHEGTYYVKANARYRDYLNKL